MFETKFLKATAERAVKTFLQTLLALLGTDAAGILTVDLVAAAQVAATAALMSVLTSLASSGVGKTGPSLAGETTDEPTVVTVEKIVEKLIPAAVAAVAPKAAPAKRATKKAPAKKKAE